MKANHEAGCDAIKRSVDAAILAGAWRAFNAGEAMAYDHKNGYDPTASLEGWAKDAGNLRIILQERSEGP